MVMQVGAAAGTVAVAPATLDNPTFRAFADFSSGGPRTGDSHLKPDITAPGVSISSTAIGTGSEAEILSGTSMAAPHTTGSAALTRQALRGWGLGAKTVQVRLKSGAHLTDFPLLEKTLTSNLLLL